MLLAFSRDLLALHHAPVRFGDKDGLSGDEAEQHGVADSEDAQVGQVALWMGKKRYGTLGGTWADLSATLLGRRLRQVLDEHDLKHVDGQH